MREKRPRHGHDRATHRPPKLCAVAMYGFCIIIAATCECVLSDVGYKCAAACSKRAPPPRELPRGYPTSRSLPCVLPLPATLSAPRFSLCGFPHGVHAVGAQSDVAHAQSAACGPACWVKRFMRTCLCAIISFRIASNPDALTSTNPAGSYRASAFKRMTRLQTRMHEMCHRRTAPSRVSQILHSCRFFSDCTFLFI